MAEVLRKILPALGLVLAVVGCAPGADRQGVPAPETPAATDTVPERVDLPLQERCTQGEEAAVGNRRAAYAARAVGRVTVHTSPGGRSLRVFAPRNVNGVATVFGLRAVVRDASCEPTWYRVQLPIRPNGAGGYVRADDVLLLRVRTRIEVDLSARRIAFLRDGRTVLRTTTAVGSPATPTPTGRYYVNQRLRAADPSGPFGPGAIGFSAFSPVLTGWAQGGPVAIHGTNDPSTIGRPVTNGCLRIANAELVRMFRAMPEGTPVIVRA